MAEEMTTFQLDKQTSSTVPCSARKVSDDFLGHCSMGVLEALESSRALGAGWRALLRRSSAAERLAVLRDPRVAEAPVAPTAHRLLPPKAGGEKTPRPPELPE